jgi:hypothetical protein
MELPDFTNLSLAQVIATLLFFAAIDTGAAYVVALMNNNFTSAYALDFLRTHIIKIGSPIVLLALVGHGVPALGIPAIPPAGLAATASLAIYVVTTIISIKDTWTDKAIPPTSTGNIAPVTETPGV